MNIQIHQMLHGYNLGHNYIQGSIVLSSIKDMDCIATLSDWSEFVNENGEPVDYVTAYPLSNSGYYVIAKTWYADEMKRPGCVWTHSILIPFISLKYIKDFRICLSWFRRPISDDRFEYYGSSFVYENYENEKYLSPKLFKIPALPSIYEGLIKPNQPLLYKIENNSIFYEQLCLLLMNYIPALMLQKLSFCTGTASVRKVNGVTMNLQFTTLRNEYIKSLNEPYIGSDQLTEWLRYVSKSIVSENESLKELLRTFNDDIGDKADKLRAFFSIIILLDKYNEENINKILLFQNIIYTLARYFPEENEGAKLKQRMMQPSITSLFCTEEQFFIEFSVTEYFKSFNQEYLNFWPRFEQLANDDKRNRYIIFLQNLCDATHLNEWGESILLRSTRFLTPKDIDEIIINYWTLFLSLVPINQEILNNERWLSLPNDKFQNVLYFICNSRVSSEFKFWKELLVAILQKNASINDDLGKKILENEKDCIEIILDFMNKSQSNSISMSLAALCRKQKKNIIRWLGIAQKLNVNVAYFIMNSVSPISQEVENCGSKRWLIFSDLHIQNMTLDYYIFLYLLSFNWKQDSYALQYMKIAFYPIHQAAKENSLDYDLWTQVSQYTESLPLWQDWDRCKKLRKMIVKRLKQSGYRKDVLINYTPDKELNKVLIHIWEKK